MAKWKNGGKPNGSTAAKLAEYFGVTTDYLLGLTENKNHPNTELDALHLSDDAITDIEKDFEPEYINIRGKASLINSLKKDNC